jgi:hypothetical protein
MFTSGSYLPLFHTFGRHLEMMGMLFEALDAAGIFEACVEALGVDEARAFLGALREEIDSPASSGPESELRPALERQLASFETGHFVPLAVRCAVERYAARAAASADATPEARQQQAENL